MDQTALPTPETIDGADIPTDPDPDATIAPAAATTVGGGPPAFVSYATDPWAGSGPTAPSASGSHPGEGLPEIPGYEVQAILGRGGMGVVYKARQARLNRPCALKMILAADQAGAVGNLRFLQEAEVVARLDHPNIVRVHATGDHRGYPFIELEFLDGGSLARKLDGRPWPPARAAALVETIARGVGAAHRAGIVHRDLKPENVLLTADGEPKVADFGLAKPGGADPGLTATGMVLGTPTYMSPEQTSGLPVGPAADVHALGIILYELLVGGPPFRGASVHLLLEQIRTADAVPPSRLVAGTPRDLETICLKCLEKNPDRRYAEAAELAEDLRRFRADEPILARRATTTERAAKWVRRNRRVAALVGLVVAATLLGLAGTSIGLALAVRRAREAEVARQEAREQLELCCEILLGRALGLIADEQPLPDDLAGYFEIIRAGQKRSLRVHAARDDLRRGMAHFFVAISYLPAIYAGDVPADCRESNREAIRLLTNAVGPGAPSPAESFAGEELAPASGAAGPSRAASFLRFARRFDAVISRDTVASRDVASLCREFHDRRSGILAALPGGGAGPADSSPGLGNGLGRGGPAFNMVGD